MAEAYPLEPEPSDWTYEGPSPTPMPAEADSAAIAWWIRENIAFYLKTEPALVDEGQPFSQMGLDSIAALTITGDLAEALGRELPQTLLWDYPTVERIAEFLAPSGEPVQVTATAPPPRDWRAIARECGMVLRHYDRMQERTATWDAAPAFAGSLARAIRQDGRGKPFFWVCDLAGTRPLADCLAPRPVYAVPSGFEVFDHTRANVLAQARYYVEEILQIQPEGPFCLGGYCYGAKVAMEAARELARRGHAVGPLVMLEWPGPQPLYWRWFRLRTFFTESSTRERVLYHFGEALAKGPLAGLRHLGDLAARVLSRRRRRLAERRAGFEAMTEDERRLAFPEEGHWDYVPEPYSGETHLYLARGSRYRSVFFPGLGWSRTLTGRVRLTLVEGTHLGVLHRPSIDGVARELAPVLERIEGACQT